MRIHKRRVFIIILYLLISGNGTVFAKDKIYQQSDFKAWWEQMVKTQIEARGVKDRRVLEIMRKIERHRFVPFSLKHLAYEDCPLPIGEGQSISQPYNNGVRIIFYSPHYSIITDLVENNSDPIIGK
jgi:hypothetical protein